jgi:hypothetical protein
MMLRSRPQGGDRAVHNPWTTGVNWGRHAGVLGTSCGQRESSKNLGSQALCCSSQPTKHSAARGNDEPPGGQLPEPRRTGRPDHCRGYDESRWPPERRSEPARKSGVRTRSGVAQDGDGRQRGARGRGNPEAARREGHRNRHHAAGPPDRAPARAAGTRVQGAARRRSAGHPRGQAARRRERVPNRIWKARTDRAIVKVWGTGTGTRPPVSHTYRGPRLMFPGGRTRDVVRHAGRDPA